MSSTSDVEHHYNRQSTGFLTPQPVWKTRRCIRDAPAASERKPRTSNQRFHVTNKIPFGDSPYVRAKHAQVLEKDPSKAVSLFWSAINAGDRVESALKDMATVMKQLDRPDEAIEAIKSFRHLCPPESQDSIDNLLLELYKVAGKYEEEIEMLLLKVKKVEEGFLFGGKRTKVGRSQGRKVEITIEKEYSKLLGNLAWAYMQQHDFHSAEEYYRKALSFGSDKNKQCNLALCLMHMNKLIEAKFLLQTIRPSDDDHMDESYGKAYERATQKLADMESQRALNHTKPAVINSGFSRQQSQRALNHTKPAVINSGFSRQQNLDGPHTPPVPSFLSRTNKRLSTDFPCEKEAGFTRRIYCQYDSPCFNKETPKVPFTQPRRCPWSFSSPDQRMSEEHFRRKLPFGPSTEHGNGHSLMNRNTCSSSASPKVPLPSPRRPSPRREWRENFVDNVEKVKKDPEEPFERNKTRNNSCLLAYCGDAKPAQERDLALASTCTADSHNFSSISTLDAETVTTCDPQIGQGKIYEFSTSDRKKSWADMVEEDEQERENWRKQFSVGFADNGDCNDETVNFRMISETPRQLQKSGQESESFDLSAGGCFTQPEKANQKVKRSLCFDHRKDQNCTSPFKTKSFVSEGVIESLLMTG